MNRNLGWILPLVRNTGISTAQHALTNKNCAYGNSISKCFNIKTYWFWSGSSQDACVRHLCIDIHAKLINMYTFVPERTTIPAISQLGRSGGNAAPLNVLLNNTDPYHLSIRTHTSPKNNGQVPTGGQTLAVDCSHSVIDPRWLISFSNYACCKYLVENTWGSNN